MAEFPAPVQANREEPQPTTSGTITTPTNEGELPIEIQKNSLDFPGRKKRTHNVIFQHYRGTMTLEDVLKQNQQIAVDNARRAREDRLFLEDREAHPRPGSPQASLISFTDAEQNALVDPSIFEAVKQYLSLTAQAGIRAFINTAKNATSTLNPDTSSKKAERKLQPFKAKPRELGSTLVPPIDADLEKYLMHYETQTLPLPLLLTSNLKKVAQDKNHPRTKVRLPDGSTDYIFDVDTFCKRYDISQMDGSLDAMEFQEAIGNWVYMEGKRDPEGPDGTYGTFAKKHAAIFNNLPDSRESYPFWQQHEEELRKARFLERLELDYSEYRLRTLQAQTDFKRSSTQKTEDESEHEKQKELYGSDSPKSSPIF